MTAGTRGRDYYERQQAIFDRLVADQIDVMRARTYAELAQVVMRSWGKLHLFLDGREMIVSTQVE